MSAAQESPNALQRLERASLICGVLIMFAWVGFCAQGSPTPIDVMPVPAVVRLNGERFAVTDEFRVAYSKFHGARLESAAARLLRRWEERTNLQFARDGTRFATAGAARHSADSSARLSSAAFLIECNGAAPALPALGEDESYTLTITHAQIVLRSPTTTGALRGLETLGQLLSAEGKNWILPGTSIEDRPRFPWRGLMIDVCRHWQPLEALKRNIDGMALVKLNVLHLHLSDDEGFRIECRSHPELQEHGSDGHFFTHEEIKELVAYAAERGIRVVPELDLPGHCTSWLVSHPEFAAVPGKYALPRGLITAAPALDVTNEALYRLLNDVYSEVAALFPDQFFHIGGDEANYAPWNESPRIQAFIQEHDFKDAAGLQAYFARRLRDILRAQGKQVVGWEEIMRGDMPKDVLVQGWSGPERQGQGHLDALKHGYRALLSNGYYIDLNHPASSLYENEPWRGDHLPEGADPKNLLGGEATMWTEWVSTETLDSRIWPRTAAFAERMWSPREVVDLEEMYRRLAIVSQRLEEVGLQHEKNRAAMLRRLAGTSVSPEQLRALEIFTDLVEPVKEYNRGKQQGGLNYLRALNTVADCARPESDVGRAFTLMVKRYLASTRQTDSSSALREQLLVWENAGRATAELLSSCATTDPAAATVANDLVRLCQGAGIALDVLEHKRETDPSWSAHFLSDLQEIEPGRDAILLPIVPAIRNLVDSTQLPIGSPSSGLPLKTSSQLP